MKSAPSANVEERRRMMDLLKRFEEDALEDSPLLGDEDDEDSNDLHERLQNIDLGARIPGPCYTRLLIPDPSQTRPATKSCGTRSLRRSARSSSKPSMTRAASSHSSSWPVKSWRWRK